MELYNYFSEPTEDKDKVEQCYKELEPISLSVIVSQRINYKNERVYTIIGQMWGEDTNLGDTDLLVCFHSHNLQYTWFDATMPSINNIRKNKTVQETKKMVTMTITENNTKDKPFDPEPRFS